MISNYDFTNLHDEQFKADVLETFKEILEQNSFIEGQYNTQFETDFAKLQQSNNCLLVANGTDALELSLVALGVGQGDKVGIPGISFFATAECVLNIGATPVFIDVDLTTGLMDPESLKRTIEQHQLKAIIPVHIYGLPAPIKELEDICNPLDIKIVEDGAQSQGGFYLHNKAPIGSSDHLITYSFYPTKNLGALGDAGAILLNDGKLAEYITSLRNHGRTPHGHLNIGRNSRCDSFQAAALCVKMKKIEKQNEQRKEVAKLYHQGLNDTPLTLMPEEMLTHSSWHLYPVLAESAEQADALNKYLNENGIGSTQNFYRLSLPEEKPLQNFEGEKALSKEHAARCFCLPLNPFLEESHINEVCEKIRSFFS